MSDIDTTGATDSTAAMIALCSMGGNVEFPAGIIRISQPIMITQPGWYHGKRSATTILMNDPTADAFQILGDYIVLGDLCFDSAVPRTGGAYLNVLAGTHIFVFENYQMNHGFIGILISPGDGTPAQTTTDLQFLNGRIFNTVPTVGESIQIHQGYAIKFDGLLASHTAQIASNFHVVGCADIELAHANIMTGGYNVWLDAQYGSPICSFWAHDCFFDSSAYGIYMHASNGQSIVRSRIANCWMSGHIYNGALLATDGSGVIDGISFSSPHIFSNGGNGVYIRDTGCKNIHFIDPQICGNGTKGAASGLVVGDGVTGLQVKGGLIGAGNGFGGQPYGLWFYGALNRSVVRDVDLSGNTNRYNAAPTGTGNVFAPLSVS